MLSFLSNCVFSQCEHLEEDTKKRNMLMEQLRSDKQLLQQQIQECQTDILRHEQETKEQADHVISLTNYITECNNKKESLTNDLENARQQKSKYMEDLSGVQDGVNCVLKEKVEDSEEHLAILSTFVRLGILVWSGGILMTFFRSNSTLADFRIVDFASSSVFDRISDHVFTSSLGLALCGLCRARLRTVCSFACTGLSVLPHSSFSSLHIHSAFFHSNFYFNLHFSSSLFCSSNELSFHSSISFITFLCFSCFLFRVSLSSLSSID